MGITFNLKKNKIGIPLPTAYGRISHAEYLNGVDGPKIRYRVDMYSNKAVRFTDAWAIPVDTQLFEIDHQDAGSLPIQAYTHLKSLGDYKDPKGFDADFSGAIDELSDPPKPNPYPNPDDIPGGLTNPLHPDHKPK